MRMTSVYSWVRFGRWQRTLPPRNEKRASESKNDGRACGRVMYNLFSFIWFEKRVPLIFNTCLVEQMSNLKVGDVPPVPRMRLPTEEPDDVDDEWLGTFEDDLTMAIAVRDWDQAVVLVKRGATGNNPILILRC
jgi:hypothetical protein